MKIAGRYWSYTGRTHLDLHSNGSFTMEASNGRVWGEWKGGGIFSTSLTFTAQGQQFVCSVERGTDQSIGSNWIEIRSRKGSPVDGKWYVRKE